MRCQSTKITKIPEANTNLALDLHSSSPQPVNFFGAQSSLGVGTIFVWGGQNSHLGGHGPEIPPVAPGLAEKYGTLVRYAFFVMVLVRYVGTASKLELKNGTLVRYGSRCEVRSTQILSVPYCRPW